MKSSSSLLAERQRTGGATADQCCSRLHLPGRPLAANDHPAQAFRRRTKTQLGLTPLTRRGSRLEETRPRVSSTPIRSPTFQLLSLILNARVDCPCQAEAASISCISTPVNIERSRALQNVNIPATSHLDSARGNKNSTAPSRRRHIISLQSQRPLCDGETFDVMSTRPINLGVLQSVTTASPTAPFIPLTTSVPSETRPAAHRYPTARAWTTLTSCPGVIGASSA